jgi:eukaryotic-like serine/threonine-protein kinase
MPDDDDRPTMPTGPATDPDIGPWLPPAAAGGAHGESPSTLTRFRLDAVIGRGGMGEVISARDEQIGRSVAIKRLRPDKADRAAVARFLREARIQGQLEHPAVPPVYELLHDDRGSPFFVMKQLAGTTLHAVIAGLAAGDRAATQAFPRQRLLRAFAEVCLAIEFAHSRGVLHRDLKPANIMLGEFGEIYVLDWGVAQVHGDPGPRGTLELDDASAEAAATQGGAIVGTPGYMSPEQILGEPLDARSDVYALGCILFEILALEPLHPSGHAGMVTALTDPDRASARRPDRDVPPELDQLCAATTATDRAARPASARALGAAVQRYLDGDRDLAQRAQLAQRERGAGGDGPVERQAAMRAAGRALALDPADAAPAEIIARLMLAPPSSAPPAVERALAERDLDALHAARRLGARAAIVAALFFPFLAWAGFRDPLPLAVGVGLVAVIALTSATARRSTTVASGRLVLAGWVLLLALFGHIATPFLLAPGLAVVVAMSIGLHPNIARPSVLCLLIAGAVLAPWLAAPGVVTIVDRDIILHTANTLDPTAVRVGLATFIVSVIAVAVLLARSLIRDRRESERLLEYQAWQLRGLVSGAP